MALDEVICERVRENKSGVCLRIYSWKPSAISIGHFQGMTHEIDINACKAKGIYYVRRRTGGGAVYHDREGEITYSIIGPEKFFPENLAKSYEYICAPIINTLKKIGINAEFKPINDIIVNGKKISGNAQTRKKGVLLQHGTILYSVDVDLMFSILKVGKEKIAAKLIESVKSTVTSIKEQKEISKEDVIKIFEEEAGTYFFKGEYELSDYNNDELDDAKRLAKEIYSTDAWNFQR